VAVADAGGQLRVGGSGERALQLVGVGGRRRGAAQRARAREDREERDRVGRVAAGLGGAEGPAASGEGQGEGRGDEGEGREAHTVRLPPATLFTVRQR
jgi:hypothetical protein